jgi:hypothetical protein
MASVHVYVRSQVVGDAATVAKIKDLADGLNEAIVDAGGTKGSATVVDDPPDSVPVTTAAEANADAEGRG